MRSRLLPAHARRFHRLNALIVNQLIDAQPLREEFHPRPAPVIDRSRAAEILQIGRTTLYRKMKQYGLD